MNDARRTTPGIGYDADLAHRFTYHPPEPEQPEVYETVRDLGHLMALLIDYATPSSREKSLALTHIEEAVMWANAAIARRGLSGGGLAGAPDLIEAAFQALMGAKPEGHLASALSDTVPPKAHDGAAADPGDGTPTDDPWSRPEPPYTMLLAGLTAIAAMAGAQGNHTLASYAHTILSGEELPHPDLATSTTDDLDGDHPAAWGAVCPICPAYTDTSDIRHGRQRAAQEWLADHLAIVHGKAVR